MTWAAVGTAAAIGAGVGGISAAIQGEDVLTGALIGGATGAVTGGIGGAGSGVTTEAASQLAPELVNTAAINAVPIDTVVQQAAPELLNQAAPELLSQVAPAGIEQITPEMLNAVNQGSADAIAAQGTGVQSAGINNIGYTPSAAAPPVGPSPTSMTPAELTQMTTAETGIVPNQPLATTPPGTPIETPYSGPSNLISEPPTNPFLDGLKSVGSYMDANPIKTAGALYLGANALGAFDQNSASGGIGTEKEPYKNPNPLSADFNRNRPTPNVYKPMTYQEGGIASVPRYYRGELATSRGQKGDVYGATQRFLDMYDPAGRYTPPPGASDPNVGIFRDSNPSTASKSALEAADIRRKAIENRAYVKTGANYMPASREMGELDFTIIGSKDKKNKRSESDSVLAASGGIMQANLGGYAAGGNPRLLRGPGDGMSDNIPAVIGNKQPARLADGEFVVPADVVSHLGNGSTEAGAKRLHEMMNQVRIDRTGRKKQAPAVKAKKYIPK